MLSDTELVESFIETSLRGQDTLLANKHLMAEGRLGTNQLTSKQHGLVMKVTPQEQPVQFWVRQNIAASLPLAELLERHQFMPAGDEQDGFCRYHYIATRPGYHLHRESARALWKTWRTLYRLHENMEQAQKLLIQQGHDWEQIKKITVSTDLMFVETAEGETSHHMEDQIAWMSEARVAAPPPPRAQSAGGFAADGYLS